MSAQPISLRDDIEKLASDGLRVRILDGKSVAHLLVDGVPAVTSKKIVERGTLYSPLELNQERAVSGPMHHQCYWIGEMPCLIDGTPHEDLISSKNGGDKGDDIKVNVDFSRRPDGRDDYLDYYEKIWTYVNLLHAEALKIDPNCTPLQPKPTFVVMENLVAAQRRVFRYPDMASTRAGIGAMSEKLITDRVAIIGIGGTGSYILDLLAKTLVTEIHVFDGDDFEMHNAFRAPGAPDKSTFDEPVKKANWFADLYDRIHMGIKAHPYHVNGQNLDELRSMNFVFVSIDDSDARGVILRGLMAMGVPFIDVGMDMEIEMNTSMIGGSCRVTLGLPGRYEHIEEVVPMRKLVGNDIYRNIQVADMNMLNAAFAVGKWKKVRAFYVDDQGEKDSLYTLDYHGISRSYLR